jgi:predicted amidohydrolase YtcJ
MQADMTVLSGNPLETPAEELTTLRVTQTWVGGRP